MSLPAPDFSWIFTEGNVFSFEGEDLSGTISVVPGGELALPSGRIIACDPLVYLGSGDLEPFTVAVPPGRYPVSVAAVTVARPSGPPAITPHQRVAAARLTIKDTPVAAWEPALLPGQDPAGLGAGQFYGYGVDAGTGCFVDAASDAAFAVGDDDVDDGPLMRAFEASDWRACPHNVTDPSGAHNVVAFSSGWGDGAYPTWIGRDGDGEVACLVTDFFVVPAEAIPAAVAA